MREASVLPGSGGRRWGCLKIPILHACPSAAAWRAASLTLASTWRCLPTGAPFSSPSSSLLGSVHHASVGLGCQDQGRSLVLVLTGSSWGNGGMDRVLLQSQPSPHLKRSLLHKVDSCQESPRASFFKACLLFLLLLPKPWMVKVGAGSLCGVD